MEKANSEDFSELQWIEEKNSTKAQSEFQKSTSGEKTDWSGDEKQLYGFECPNCGGTVNPCFFTEEMIIFVCKNIKVSILYFIWQAST